MCTDSVIQLAGAIARRHPKLLKGVEEPTVSAGADQLIRRWAETLSPDLQLAFSDGYDAADAIGLWSADRAPVYMQGAFERLQAAVPGAGTELFQCLDLMSGWNMVMTPKELFQRASYNFWYDEVDQEKFRQAIIDNDGEFDEGMRGPAAFFEDFPGLPAEVVEPKRPRYKARTLATRYAKLASEQSDPQLRALLAAISACFKFAGRRHKRVWDLGNSGDWEQAVIAYYIRWSPEDDGDRWVDDVMQYLWDGGTGTDATLVFQPSDMPLKPADQLRRWDDLVSCIEGCSAHQQVMDQLFAALGDLDESHED